MNKIRGSAIYFTLVIAVVIVSAFFLVPGLRGIVSDVQRTYAPRDVYAPVRSAVDKCLSGTQYSVLHIPTAGIAVVLNVSPSDAKKIADPTINLAPPGSIFIDPSYSDYASNPANLGVQSVPELQDCFQLTIPRSNVAAIVVDWDIPSTDTLTAILNGVNLKELGPGLNSGTYVIFDNDHTLVQRLYAAGVITGTVQTSASEGTCDTASNPNCTHDVIVPLEKYRVMDVRCGHVASVRK